MIIKSIEKGVDFLVSNQNENGSYPETVYFLKEGVWKKNYPSLFSSSLISNSVSEILKKRDLMSDEIISKSEQLQKKSFEFFVSEMKMPGIWKFGASCDEMWRNLPFDLDDTCTISFLLKDHHPYIHFGMNRNIIIKNRNEAGLFYTWILPPALAEKNDIDSIVNVNTILYLGENPATSKALDYICKLINEDREEGSSYYYLNRFFLYYFISRAYSNGCLGFEKCKDSIINKLLTAGAELNNVLLKAISITSLVNFGFCKQDILASKTEEIFNGMNSDGSWEKIPFYQGGEYPKPISLYYGSESITTTVCLEGLVKYLSVL